LIHVTNVVDPVNELDELCRAADEPQALTVGVLTRLAIHAGVMLRVGQLLDQLDDVLGHVALDLGDVIRAVLEDIVQPSGGNVVLQHIGQDRHTGGHTAWVLDVRAAGVLTLLVLVSVSSEGGGFEDQVHRWLYRDSSFSRSMRAFSVRPSSASG
jgi:hypothetical protein